MVRIEWKNGNKIFAAYVSQYVVQEINGKPFFVFKHRGVIRTVDPESIVSIT